MKSNKSDMIDIIFIVLATLCGFYLFIINHICQPALWRDWFVRTIPKELAVMNIVILCMIFFSITLFVSKVPQAIRFFLLLALFILGSFERVSMEAAPSITGPIALFFMAVYLFIRNRLLKKLSVKARRLD